MAMQSQQDWSFHLECQSLIRWFIVQSDDLFNMSIWEKKASYKTLGNGRPFHCRRFFTASRDSRNSAATCSRNVVLRRATTHLAWNEKPWTPRSALFKMRKWFPVVGQTDPIAASTLWLPLLTNKQSIHLLLLALLLWFLRASCRTPSLLSIWANRRLRLVSQHCLKMIQSGAFQTDNHCQVIWKQQKWLFLYIYIYVIYFLTFWYLHIFRPIQVRKCNHDSSPLPLPKLTSYISICPGFLEALKIKSDDLHSKTLQGSQVFFEKK